MNLAYFRKSKFSREETLKNLREESQKENLKILGEVELKDANAVLVQICHSDWLETIVKSDKNLIGLMPCGVLVVEKDGEVSVGVGDPAILGGLSRDHEVQQLAAEAEETLKDLVNNVTDAEPLKVSQVRLYSTTTCPYCVMEKQWLDSNKIEHDVIYVDKNQAEAEKMVKETGQMGVPVTEIQYDGGEKEFVVGFDKRKLGSILGVN